MNRSVYFWVGERSRVLTCRGHLLPTHLTNTLVPGNSSTEEE